jgi:hypothetical protein
MKKSLMVILVTFLLLAAAGCSKAKEDTSEKADSNAAYATESSAESDSADTAAGTMDSAPGDSMESTEALSEGTMEESKSTSMEGTLEEAADIAAGEEERITAADESEIFPEPTQMLPSAGLLTAGEWNDNDNWGFFSNLVSGGHLLFPTYQLSPLNRVVVNVTDEAGPVKNANVVLYSKEGKVLWEAVTNYKGIAYAFYHVSESDGIPATVTVSKEEVSATADIDLNSSQGSNQGQQEQGNGSTANSSEVSVTLGNTDDRKALDIMFLFDTTGSMGDELLYLQKEFEDIAQKVSDQSTRFSVDFYRDEGDLYVVKPNDFTSDINEVMKQLNDESADGGGDTPESVEKALYNGILEHTWNKDSVKLLFLILDAPPHSGSQQINETLKEAVMEAAKQGIRIIPIASSGVDKDTETFLRTIAILTGGTYTFLTDDSGIGNSHLEPTIGSYNVEFLNECIIRLIQQYYQ